MKEKVKKKPSDYPQMAFRIEKKQKDKLAKYIDQLHELFNKGLKDDEFKVKKNEIVIKALELGLAELRRRKSLE